MSHARKLLLPMFLAALLPACDSASRPAPAAEEQFSTDVPGIEAPMLSADFWLARLADDELRMDSAAIDAFNAASFARGEYLHDLGDFPESLPRAGVLELLDGISTEPGSARYYADGREVGQADYARLQQAAQREAIPEQVKVRWGLVTRRDSMRSFPTRERVFKQPGDLDLDRFQETGVFPGQRLALLHESADGNWWFAVNYHYAAWLPKESVAVGPREQIEQWHQREPRLVISGAQVHTNFNPVDARTSELALDMGVSLPLLSAGEVGHNVHGQNPYASYIVQLPVRGAQGELEFQPALIARSRDVSPGHLVYRPSTLLTQAFKFLGERYGWGHDYNGRDCTGFVGEIYKSVGILMPRNSGQQGKGGFAPTQFFDEGSSEEKLAALRALEVGDLLYIPGHVMMYIGQVDGEPYVIHDVTGLSYFDTENNFYRGTLSGVSVTPLAPMQAGRDRTYIDSIYAIKSIRTSL